MSAVAGLRGTGDWGTDERPKNFRESILFYQPNGTAPIFGLTSKAGKKTVDDPEFAWWNEGQLLVRLQVNGALSSSDTVVTVDSADPTTTTMSANYGTAQHLKPGDLLLVEPSADNATFDHELLEVVSVQSDTQFTVSRGAGGTSAASIADNLYLWLIGSAYAEGTAAPSATSRNPVKFFNYTQIFKNSYELSKTADETRARTGDAWSNDKKRKMFDHARSIELSILYGRRYEGTGDNGKPKRFMGGIRYFLPSANVTKFSSAVTIDTFFTAVAPMYQYETGAGDSRIAFCGRTAANELAKIFAAGYTYQTTNATVKAYGMEFQEFNMPMGRLLIKIHPLMSQNVVGAGSLTQDKAMYAVDFDAIKYVTMKNRDTKTYDDVQNKDEDVRRGYVQTECSLMVDYGGLSMAYLGNISKT